MKSYLSDAFALSLIFGILSSVASAPYKKCVNAALALILSARLLLPLSTLDIGISSTLPDLDDLTQSGEYSQSVKEAFEYGIRSYLSRELSLDEDCIEVEAVGFDAAAMRAERILVTLTKRGALVNTKKVKALIEEAELGEAEVKIEI